MRTIELLEQGSGRDVECSICNSQMHLSLLNRVGVRQVVPTLVGGAQWWQDSSTPTRRSVIQWHQATASHFLVD